MLKKQLILKTRKMLLTKEESYENVKICCICKEKFEDKYEKDKRILES